MSDKRHANQRAADTWKRWEMASFDAPPALDKPVRKPAAPDPAVLKAEIKRLQETAQTLGHAEGYAAGHTQGLAAGTEEGLKTGHQKGYDEGYSAGHTAGQEHARQEAERLRALAQACAESISFIEAQTGQALIALSIQIAEQVLRSTLDAHPEKIQDLIQEITHQESGKETLLKLRVNPLDLELVQQFLKDDPTTGPWRLAADPSIERGGCLADTALGSIDATLQTRWQRVTSALGHETTLAPKTP